MGIKKEEPSRGPSFFVSMQASGLLAQAQLLDDGAVAFDVAVLQVVQQGAALTYQHSQSSFSAIIFSVELQVLSQTGNTVGKQSNLGLGACFLAASKYIVFNE